MTAPRAPAPLPSARLSRLAAWLPPAGAILLVLLFFWKLAFTNLILARGDTFLYFYPYWDYRAQALLAGRLPLWDPLLFMGAPFLANSQAGVLYPFNWPLSWLAAPQAVKLSLVFHLALAALGVFAFARRALRQSPLAALLAAALFSLGGYLTAQIEHVNQLQGLAWLPWLLLAAHVLTQRLVSSPRLFSRATLRALAPPALAASILLTLQILAGHTQTAFISLAGVFLYAFVFSFSFQPSSHISPFPLREGGRGVRSPTPSDLPPSSDSNEDTRPPSSHISPFPLREGGRGVRSPAPSDLPPSSDSYEDTRPPSSPLSPFPFSEGGRGVRSAFLLLASAALAVALSAAQVLPTLELSSQSLRGGGLPLREALSFSLDPRLLGRALLPGYSRTLFSEFVAYSSLTGLALALAGLRRRPERLAVLALALVGLGFALGAYDPLYVLLAAFPPFNLFRAPARWLALFALAVALLAGAGLDELATASRRRQVVMLLGPLGLIALTPLAARLVPSGETGPLGLPTALELVGWLLPLGLLAALLWLPVRPSWRAALAAALALVELFVASWVLPYNHLTTPDAYTSIRPAMTQLLAARDAAPTDPRLNSVAPDRFLSMSALRFDPGDLAELQGELNPQLPPDAVYDALIATKNKEVLSPNLPLTWGLPAADGYDGGVLPLRHYADFTQLLTGVPSSDGRLRENLSGVPDPRLLSLMNVRYLITDKVDDAWVNGVFYDRQFTLTLAAGQTAPIAYIPPFRATALGLLADTYSGQVAVTTADGHNYQLPITQSQIALPGPLVPATITLTGPLTLRGLSLIDTRTGAFQSLTLGPYRLVHSGDVKIYKNLDVLPRAFIAPVVSPNESDDMARDSLADPGFPVRLNVIFPDEHPQLPVGAAYSPATITAYAPERIDLTAAGTGTLILTDAYYPGWTATIDGLPAPIRRVDIMFRGLALPPSGGNHQIEFRYNPPSVWRGFVISGTAWLAVLVALLLLRITKQAPGSPAPVATT